KFIGGTPGDLGYQAPVNVDSVGNLVPRTEIELGAICPPLRQNATGPQACAPHQAVRVEFHWVCPGAANVNSNICLEQDFFITVTPDGKVVLPADGTTFNTNQPPGVLPPPCPRGYLIGWVVNATTLQPIKFDALIGNAVIRGPNLGATSPLAPNLSTAVSA